MKGLRQEGARAQARVVRVRACVCGGVRKGGGDEREGVREHPCAGHAIHKGACLGPNLCENPCALPPAPLKRYSPWEAAAAGFPRVLLVLDHTPPQAPDSTACRTRALLWSCTQSPVKAHPQPQASPPPTSPIPNQQ